MKYTFVTGASRGIGKATAIKLAQKGYFVFLAGRNIKDLESTQKELPNKHSQIVKMDLLSLDDIKSAAEQVKKTTQHIDVLANIAGMYHDDKQHFFDIPFEQYPDNAIIKNINATLIGHILLTKYLVPLMDNTSSIVNMSGKFDEGETGVISDFITKKALEIFTKQLPNELKDKGIRVNAISPGFVYTENVRRFFPDIKEENTLKPEFVADKIIEVAEDINLNGQIVEI